VFGSTLRTVEAPRQDIRTLVRGNEAVFRTLLRFCNRSPLLLFDAIPVLPLEPRHRNVMHEVLSSARPLANYALVFAGMELAAIVQPKRQDLHMRPKDVLLLGAQIHSNVQMRLAPVILPVCLPSVSPTGFLYAHVSYLGSIARGRSRVAPAQSEPVPEDEDEDEDEAAEAAGRDASAADGVVDGGGHRDVTQFGSKGAAH